MFDNQTRVLLALGAFVVRVMVDLHPVGGEAGARRGAGMYAENMAEVQPHMAIIVERDASPAARARLWARPDYVRGSAVRRYELALAEVGTAHAAALAWAGAAARLTIVNFAFNMAFAERISAAPIILETQDVLLDQIGSHGLPDFVDEDHETAWRRAADQQDMWRRAAACVNVSASDHAAIAPHAAYSVHVRPFSRAGAAAVRPWDEVLRANGLSDWPAEAPAIDLLLWGDWHAGNARGVSWFVDQVLDAAPGLAAARVAVVGRVTRILPARLRAHPRIMTAGFVDRLEDFVARTKLLVIADDEAASGVSIKALDALRFGQAFVSTPAGLRGLDLAGVEYRPAATAAGFAREIEALLGDAAARARRGQVAREIYSKNVSEEAYFAAWRAVIDKVDPGFGAAARAVRAMAR